MWVSKEWGNQKRSERYAEQCHSVLKHWWKIEQYLYVLIGSPRYDMDSEFKGSGERILVDIEEERPNYYPEKIFKDNEDAILIFLSFLRNPEIYIDEQEDRDTISKIKKNYDFIEKTFYEVYDDERLEELGDGKFMELIEVNLNERIKYRLSTKDYFFNSKLEVEKIKNSDYEEIVKERKIIRVYEKDTEEMLSNLKEILLEYAHYKK